LLQLTLAGDTEEAQGVDKKGGMKVISEFVGLKNK
jgi:hypothetical protein